jgi:hypothetical protein
MSQHEIGKCLMWTPKGVSHFLDLACVYIRK